MQSLLEMTEALFVSSVRQHELAEQVEKVNSVIRDKHARFESLFDASPVGMYLVDPEFCIRLVSPKARPVFGRFGDLIGCDLGDLLRSLWSPETADEIVARFRHTLETGEPYRAPEFSGVRIDGKSQDYYDWQIFRIALPDGQVGVVCFFMDISARVLAERSLHESDERFHDLADNIPQLAWIADAESDGQINWFNKNWFKYTGTTLEEVRGSGWKAVHHPDHVDRVTRKFEHHVRMGLDWEDTFPLRGRDGRYRWFLSRMKVTRDESGAVSRLFGTNTDVTEQLHMAEELRQNAALNSESDRRKDEFLAMLSHELRNPLAAISNAMHLLRLQEDEDPLQQHARAIIERQVAQLVRIVEDLMEVSRITTGRLQLRQDRVDVGGIVERAVETTRPLMDQRRHKLAVSLPRRPIWLCADAARLEQVLVNLLTNAAKYTNMGGYVWLTVEESGDECQLRVRDTGMGIAPELLPRVFDLFTQAERSLDRSQGGLGIGLALVKRLVEMHRGWVEVHSVLEQGSEFVVHLPVVRTPEAQPPSNPKEAAGPVGASLRIVVVDDNVDSAKTMAMLLKRFGHDVRTADDGPTALVAADRFRPDVVLLDIGLPGMDGYEVARTIRERPEFRGVVLIAITGYGRESDRNRSREAGFDHHLVKPVEFDNLLQILAATPAKAT